MWNNYITSQARTRALIWDLNIIIQARPNTIIRPRIRVLNFLSYLALVHL